MIEINFFYRNILINYCFLRKKCNKKEINDKFERLYDFVRTNKKFPAFDSEFQFSTYWIEKNKKRWIVRFRNWMFSNYEENFRRWNRLKETKNFEDQPEISEFLKKAVNYQRVNFIFPIRMKWFNENSEAIFFYLEQNCNERFD